MRPDVRRTQLRRAALLRRTPLPRYVEAADARLAEREETLLRAGADAALERARLTSRLRRLKLACGRWRADYQRDVQRRYQATVAEVEARYMSEISTLLREVYLSRMIISPTKIPRLARSDCPDAAAQGIRE